MFVFPAHRFNPEPVKAGVNERVLSGGESLSGDTDAIATDGGGRWEITYSNIQLSDTGLQRLWEQWTSYMAGGITSFLVPLLSIDTAPRPVSGSGLASPSDIYADDPDFPTVVRFADPYITAEIADNAELRATSVTIAVYQGAQINGGEKFSIDNRAYKIERVTARSGMQATCTISPPLRLAVSEGDPVNFEWPLVQVRLAPGQDLTPEIDWEGAATVSLSFVEDFSTDPTSNAGMLRNEADGIAADFTQSLDANRVITRIDGETARSAASAIVHDLYGTGLPTRITNKDGSRSWALHNLFAHSDAPATQNITTVVGEQYTVGNIVGSGHFALSGAGSGTADASGPLTITASTTTLTLTKSGTVTQAQVCIGATLTDYVANTTTGTLTLPPVTWDAALGCYVLLIEPGRTNFFLNSGAAATQTISLAAGTYIVWVEGSGSLLISGGRGTATAGTSKTFTLSTTTSVTFTKTGALSHVQVEQGTYPTSQIVTYGASRARLVGAPRIAFADMPATLQAANSSSAPMTLYVDYAYTAADGTLESIASIGTDAAADFIDMRMATAVPYIYRRSASDTLTNRALLSEGVITGSPPTTGVAVNTIPRDPDTRIQATISIETGQILTSVDGLPMTIDGTQLEAIPTPGTHLWLGTFVGSNFSTGPIRIRRLAMLPSRTKAGQMPGRLTTVGRSADVLHAFFTYGQSNAAGNGALADPAGLDAPNGVKQYSQVGVVSAAVEPLKNPLPTSGTSAPYNGVALAVVRDKLAPTTPGEEWVVEGGGIGNTAFGDADGWGVGKAYHNNVISMIASLQLYFPNAVPEIGFIAMGEADGVTYGSSEAAFKANVEAAILDIRDQIGLEIPFVLGGPQPAYVSDHPTEMGHIIAALQDVAADLPLVKYADSSGIAPNTVDHAHFSAAQNRGTWRDVVGARALELL